MTNNDTKDRVLALFPDNNEYDISAGDMRAYIEAIFSDKEVQVIKIATSNDIPFNNTNIYEGSLVVIYRGTTPDEKGLYLSTINQPLDISQLIRISPEPSLNSIIIDVDDAKDGDILVLENGVWTAKDDLDNTKYKTELLGLYKEAEDNYFKELVYDDGDIIQINIYKDDTKNEQLFTKDISYNDDGNIESVVILDNINSNKITKTINYSGDNISNIYLDFTKA